MSYSFTFSKTFLAFVYFFNTCFLLTSTHEYIGEITPKRLEIEIGSSANITCRMNLEMFHHGEDSRSMYFMEDDTKNRVPQSEIAIINDDTIVFMLKNATAQNRIYTCLSGKNGIENAHVAVGTPPLNVESFKCRAYDYQNMTCNFTIPANEIPTLYNLTYYVTSPRYIQICDIEKKGSYALCKMSKANALYKQHYEFYNFTLTGSNSLGMKRQSFWINHFESVVPAEPVLHLRQVRNDSAIFRWRMDMLSYKNNRLLYDLRLRPDKFAWSDFKDFSIHKNKSGYFLELYNLPYAFYNYTLGFRLRVNSPHHDEDLWSTAHEHRFATSSCLPDAPPKTDVGSFDLIDATESRVRLYWVQRPFYRENGANFQYVVTHVRRDGADVDMSPLQIDRTSAVFAWNRNNKYEFVIKSRNDFGDSVESSRIVVPAVGTIRISDFSPNWIRNIYHEPNRTYTLSWNEPKQQNELIDYTVFWCYSKLANTNECKDTVQFKHLDKHITKYTTESQKQDQTLTLAVSANYKNFTTGMHWTMCAADISSSLIKMEPQLKQVSSTEIDVQWNLEYICTSLLEGYNLTYCPIVDSTHCLNGNSTTITVEKNAKHYLISNLRPYTLYKIKMFMFSKLKVGKISDAQFIQTKEAASSPPRNLRVSNITSDSVLLTWLPPSEMNGVITKYTVVENNDIHKIICNKHALDNPCGDSEDDEITYKLELLSSYTNYTVYVVAHTVEPSMPSNEIKFTTLVGIPSSPQTIKNNGTILQWIQPNLTSDRVDFYEISIESWDKENKKEERIYGVINSTLCSITIPPCLDKNQMHFVRVTAVTAVLRANELDLQLLNKSRMYDVNDHPLTQYYTDGEQLQCDNNEMTKEMQLKIWNSYHNSEDYVFYRSHGENGHTYRCAPAREDYFILVYIIAVGVGVIIGAVFVKCSYDKFQKMSDIHATLPIGIQNHIKDNDGFVKGHNHERDNDFYMHISKESSHNEHRRLLISDSGYMGGGGGVNGGAGSGNDVSQMGVSTPPISIGRSSSGYEGGSTEERLGNYCNADNFAAAKLTKAAKDDVVPPPLPPPPPAYTIMHVGKQFQTENTTEFNNGGYVPPSCLGLVEPQPKPYTTMTQSSLSFIPPANSYVKPNQFFNNMPTQRSPLRTTSVTPAAAYGTAINTSAMPGISSSGYVQRQPPTAFQKPTGPAYVSYTTLDALNKQENSTTTAFQTPAQPPSGYVTHRELSALGQHRFS